MATVLVKQPILVVRDGKQVAPPVGKNFDLTDAEVKEIAELNPAAIRVVTVEEKKAK